MPFYAIITLIMKLIIGLGNPGEKYKNNRHNVGRMFVREVGEVRGVRVLESDIFMNESGKFVKKHLGDMGDLRNLYIVHDDLDIPLGQYKIQFGVGPKVHNGVNNIEDVLGTKDFWRIRIGIDRRSLRSSPSAAGLNRDPWMPGEQYVLEDFTKEELEILTKVFEQVAQEISKAKE